MGGDQAMIVAGIGCRTGCSADAVAALVTEAAHQAGARPVLLAAPAFRQRSPALVEAAKRLGLPLRFVPDEALRAAQPRCRTMSARALAATGFGSVSEACALAAAGQDSMLLLPRIASDGVTCALAGSGVA